MEKFFRIGCQIDEVKLIDLVLRRYHTLDVMKVLSLDRFIKLILLALEEESKEQFRREWLAMIPMMLFSGKYMTFEEYYNNVSGKNIDMRPAEEIMAEIDRAHAKAKGEVNGT